MFDLGNRLADLRKGRGLSQQELANRLGMTRSAVGMYETGKREPDLKTLLMLADFFGVDMDTLLGRVGENFPFPGDFPAGVSGYRRIPILGRISAGLPLYAEQNVEGYILAPGSRDAEYFALRVTGDSMNAARIQDGDLLIVRRQDTVENGEIAVVLVDGDDATVKRFYASDNRVTLLPQSVNPIHQPQFYDLRNTSIRILGKAVRVECAL